VRTGDYKTKIVRAGGSVEAEPATRTRTSKAGVEREAASAV